MPTVRGGVFEGFELYLSHRGASFGALLRTAGVDPETFSPATSELPLDTVAAIFENAAAELDDPCLGLHWAEAFPSGGTGVFGYLLLSARTLEEAMVTVCRYLTLVIHPSQVEFTKTSTTATITWSLPPTFKTPAVQYILFSVAATALRLRTLAGAGWTPQSIELAHRKLPCAAALTRVFGCPVDFNCAANSIIVATSTLARKSKIADTKVFGLFKDLGDRLLEELDGPPEISGQARKAIVGRLTSGHVSLDTVAEDLDLSSRSLQSRLAAADTSFEALLNDTRMTLATGYLRDTDLPLTEIALLLGFSELSAFTRAAQRWFGEPPSAHRQALRQGPSRSEKKVPRV